MTAKVLISGAGPVGLTLACLLKRAGVDVDIVDMKAATVTDSRALGIHARTLEVFQSLGLAEEFVRRGRVTRYMTFHDEKQALFSFDFQTLKSETAFPYYLILPQNDTEAILYRHFLELGGTVQWETPVRSLVEHGGGVTVHFEDRSQDYDFLVGCDGANSLVRQSLGIDFDGFTYDARFVLSEVRIAEDRLPTDATHVMMARNTMIAAIPMPNGAYRLVGPDAAAPLDGASGAQMSFDSFADFLKRNELLQGVQFRDAERVLSYNMHKRVASRFMTDRVFLAGDAAHIHSPAGGQGMNTGIQDAANLAWKLGFVLNGEAPTSLLQSYGQERHRIATKIANGTDRAMRIVGSKSWLMRAALRFVAPAVLSLYQPRALMRSIAQLSIRLTPDGTDAGPVAPGTRLPWVLLADGTDLFDHIEPGRLLLLDLSETATKIACSDVVKQLQLKENRYFRGAETAGLPARPINRSQLAKLHGARRLLIRPDGYVAATDWGDGERHVEMALARLTSAEGHA